MQHLHLQSAIKTKQISITDADLLPVKFPGLPVPNIKALVDNCAMGSHGNLLA
jgi:hypothetical protein